MLHVCERLSDRENAPMDCAESGRRCDEIPGSGHFCVVPPGAECEPLSFTSTCTDGVIEYCRADGTLHQVDCRAYGLSGCTTNFRGEAYCAE